MSETSSVVRPCEKSHTFHAECLERWIASNTRCPVCSKASSDGYTPLFLYLDPIHVPVINSQAVKTPYISHNQPEDNMYVDEDDSRECCDCCCCMLNDSINDDCTIL